MQTKKRVSGRNATKEHGSTRVSRSQKKASEIIQAAEKKVAELITSSVRKHKPVGTLPKKNTEPIALTILSSRCNLMPDETSDACIEYDTTKGVAMDSKGYSEETDHKGSETIFSPTFHTSKSAGGDITNGENHIYSDTALDGCSNDMEVNTSMQSTNSSVQILGCQMLNLEKTQNSCCDADLGVNLSSEVSAIYLAMKNSKLECVDEQGQDSMSTDVCVDEDDYEEFDDFDPYLFIKNLPDLSTVVPAFRPVLLPRQTRSCPTTSLVLDLDETLVHSSLEPCNDSDFTFSVNFNLREHTVYVRCRPHLQEFMERVSSLFEIIIFTASQSIYAQQLLNVLDPTRKLIRHRIYRDSCVFVDGNYLKDLSVLGRDLSRVTIIDNSPQAFGFQVENGIPIESWFDDRSDQELLLLLPFLESLVGVEDVRPLIAKKFKLGDKIASAGVGVI